MESQRNFLIKFVFDTILQMKINAMVRNHIYHLESVLGRK